MKPIRTSFWVVWGGKDCHNYKSLAFVTNQNNDGISQELSKLQPVGHSLPTPGIGYDGNYALRLSNAITTRS